VVRPRNHHANATFSGAPFGKRVKRGSVNSSAFIPAPNGRSAAAAACRSRAALWCVVNEFVKISAIRVKAFAFAGLFFIFPLLAR
jgi:hypothetical protein